MLRDRAALSRAALVLALALWARPTAAAPLALYNTSCPTVADSATSDATGNNLLCNSSNLWQYPAYIIGSLGAGGSAAVCGASTAGMIEWTGSGITPNNTLQYCNGSSWVTVNGVASSVPLSGITAATGSNIFDSGSWAQVWEWGTLSTGTALTLTTSSMTTGTLLSLGNTSTAASGDVLNILSSTTSTGIGVYSAMTSTGNAGYAGYFANTATINTGYAIYATNTGAGYALGATGTSTFNGYVGIGMTAPAQPVDILTSGGSLHVYLGTPYTNNAYAGLGVGTSGVASNGNYLILSDGNSTWINAPGAGGITFRTNGNTVTPMFLTTTGSVGIGTSAPSDVLTVSGGNINIATSTDALKLGGTIVLTYPDSGNDTSSWAVGPGALAEQTTAGVSNTAVGYEALNALTNGGANTALGFEAGENANSSYNTIMGHQALTGTITGGINTAIGDSAMISATGGASENTAVGASALDSLTTGLGNTGVGRDALYYMTNGVGTALGSHAGLNVTTGIDNVAVGFDALGGNANSMSGSYNVAVGDYALNTQSGNTSNNTALGRTALYSLTTGANNTAVGFQAGYAGTAVTTGSNGVYLGYQAGANGAADTNEIAIGAGVTGIGSNSLNIGNAIFVTGMTGSVSSPAGSVGIGTANPAATLDVETPNSSTDAIYWRDSSGDRVGILSNSGGGNHGVMILYNAGTSVIRFDATGNSYFNTGGNIGIGTTTPQAALDVNGGARVGNDTASCSSTNAGEVKYTSSTFWGCNGSTWVPMDSGMHYIGNAVAATTTSLQFDSANSNWSSSYNTLFLNCTGLVLSATSCVRFWVGESSGPTWETGAHYNVEGFFSYANGGPIAINNGSANTGADLTNHLFCSGNTTTTTIPITLEAYINNVSTSSLYKMVHTQFSVYDYEGSSDYDYGAVGAYWANDKNAITGLELTTTGGGNFTSGTCTLYGMN